MKAVVAVYIFKSYQNLSNPSRAAEKCHLIPSESELLFYQLSKGTVGNTRFNLYAKRIYALEPEIRVTEITIIMGAWDHFSRNKTKCNKNSGQREINPTKESPRAP